MTNGRPKDDASSNFLEIIEIRPNDIPKSKREEEVDQSEETDEEHLDDDATGGVSGRRKTIAGTTNETESESLKNIRLTNGRPKDDASSDLLEISEDENQTDAEESDTEPDSLAKTQSGVIDEMKEGEDKHSGTNEPNWISNHAEDNSMDSADINQGDMGKEICSVGITQGKVFEGEYNRIEKPDRTSIPVVNIQAIDEIENCKHIQEEINMRSFLKVIDAERSATESDCSNKILTMDNGH